DADDAGVRRLAEVLVQVKDTVRFCEICGNVSADERCRICTDPRRTDEVICVVEESKDIIAIEKIREVKGRYHVLGGAIDPTRGGEPAPTACAPPSGCAAAARARRRRCSPRWTRTSRARPPPPTSRACWGRWRSPSPASPPACPSAATWTTPTRCPWGAPSWSDSTFDMAIYGTVYDIYPRTVPYASATAPALPT